MFQKFKTLRKQSKMADFHQDLINLFISVSYKSSIAYLSSLAIYVWFLSEFIPASVLLPWTLVHLFYQVFRFYFARRYKNRTLTKKGKVKFLYEHIILAFIGGTTWGIGSVLCVVYAPTPYEYIVLTLIVGMAAGSISTLSPIFRVFVAFVLPILLFLTVAFIYKGDDMHSAIAVMILIFTAVVMSASWDAHKNLRRSVELKELYAQSQEQLREINVSLEERVSKEVEYNRQKDQHMLEQSRLAQMGEMISMIAHQWRQPLSAITAATGSMTLHIQLEGYKEEYIEEKIQDINTYTQYLSTTISDFRNFFKPDKEKSLTSLNEIVKGSLKIIGTSLESQGVRIDSSLASKEEFSSYPNELKQVVLNILKNAQDVFIEKGIKEGRISIRTDSMEDAFQLRISDNAGGIPEENIAYIFDPYFTTKESLDGTGLGLYMSKMIVEDHCHGSLRVENQGDGACFILTHPRT